MLRSGGKRGQRRIEPRFDNGRDDFDLRADPEDRPGSRKRAGKKRRARRGVLGTLAYWTFVLGVWGVVGLGGLFAYYASQLPPIDQLAVPKRPPDIQILGVDGAMLADRGDTGGAAVRLADLPPYLPKAFVAIEDRRFYYHFGVDPIGIFRAVVSDVAGSGGMQGGSTLTQQLAKNLFLTQERTISRKFQEAILAVWLERKYSKDQILELYLNRVYFGSGAYGVEAASRKYFGKHAKEVTLSEAALLAGLMKSPTRLAPNHNLQGANDRAGEVLTAMAAQGYITEAMAKVALADPANVAANKGAGSVNYAADYVMDALDETVGAIDQDIVVTTTIDPRMQTAAEQALTGELDAKGAKFSVNQGALVALDPDGGVKALVGGRNYAESQFNRAIAAERQPGSSFKPFVYLAALEKGVRPDDVRQDAPISVKGWSPENFHREYLGPVTLTKALALSLNTVAVRLCLEVGPKAVVKVAHRLGILSDLRAERLDRARHLRGDAARNGLGLRRLRQRRHRRASLCHHDGEDRQRPAALPPPSLQLRPGDRAALRRDDEQHDAGDAQHRHREESRPAGLAGRGQDRHDPGFPRRLVPRLHLATRRRRLARQRRRRLDEEDHRRQLCRSTSGAGSCARRCRARSRADCRSASGATMRRPPAPAAAPVASGGPLDIFKAAAPGAASGRGGAFVPPAAIPNGARAGPAPRDKNILEKLLGQL